MKTIWIQQTKCPTDLRQHHNGHRGTGQCGIYIYTNTSNGNVCDEHWSTLGAERESVSKRSGVGLGGFFVFVSVFEFVFELGDQQGLGSAARVRSHYYAQPVSPFAPYYLTSDWVQNNNLWRMQEIIFNISLGGSHFRSNYVMLLSFGRYA